MRKVLLSIVVGAIAGFASGLLGVGGGPVMVPLLTALLAFSQHHAHATSLAAIVFIAPAGAAIFGLAGDVDISAAMLLTAGALFGAPIGARLMARTSEKKLKVAFGVFMVILGVILVIG